MSEQSPTIEELFSAAPASLTFSQSADGQRTIGTSAGFVLDCWPDRVEAAAIFPPDNLELAARNATLLQLLLAVQRPHWQDSAVWLEQQLRLAAQAESGIYQCAKMLYGVRFLWHRRTSRVMLRLWQPQKYEAGKPRAKPGWLSWLNFADNIARAELASGRDPDVVFQEWCADISEDRIEKFLRHSFNWAMNKRGDTTAPRARRKKYERKDTP